MGCHVLCHYTNGVGCHVLCHHTVTGGVSCPVSLYCDGVGCHVLCHYTVTGCGVMSCVIIL